MLRNSDVVLTQTGKIREEIRKEFPRTNIKVVPNGISSYKKSTTGKNIIYVGNLFERKGISYLTDAFSGPGKLIIAGNGPMEQELRKKSRGKGIEFAGYIPRSRIRRFMAENGRILVLPAISGEGLPNVILEAMSVGIPVIATDIAGIPDVVKDGKTGILVKPRDVEGLRKAIEKLTKDKKLWERMSKNAKKEVKKYYWENVITQLEDVLESVSRRL